MATSLHRSVHVLGRGPATRRRREDAGIRIGALFDEFAPMVLAVCRFNLRDPQAAEDAAQETFLSAHRSLLGGTRPRDPAAWLATIARNECHRARRTVQTWELDDRTIGTLLDPADIVANRADLSEIASAIARLPPRQREAIVLREFCGLSYEQVAAVMSLSGSAVDSLLSRARRQLVAQVGHIPKAAQGVLIVPASLREALSRLIPGLDSAGTAAGVASGAAGAAAVASVGSAPIAAKVAAAGAAAVALALPVQATVRGDQGPRPSDRRSAAVNAPEPLPATRAPASRPVVRSVPLLSPRPEPRKVTRRSDSSGHGSHASGSGSSSGG